MNVEMMAVKDIKPFERNAKKHDEKQIKNVMESIKQFGMAQPLAVGKDNMLIIGHCRLIACKRLKMDKVPVVKMDELTQEQVDKLRLLDNKLNESEWDFDLLAEDIPTLDFSDFDIDWGLPEDLEENTEIEEDEAPEPGKFDNLAAPMQHNVFENQELMQFPINNYYGIPEMAPTQTTGEKFLRFMDWNEVDDPENYIAHFYYDDFKFMQAWRNPDKYVEKLRRFKAVIAPDFSSYTDFPIVLQILGAYRRNWCGAYWQMLGIDVIPDVQWGNTEESYKWCFEGIPENATVAISSLGVAGQNDWNGVEGDWFKRGFDEMIKRLNPKTILWYGNKIDGCEGNIIYIPSYYEQKRELLNKMQEVKKNGKR